MAPAPTGRRLWALFPALWMLAAAAAAAAGEPPRACTDAPRGPVARACYEVRPGAPIYGHAVLGETPEWHRLVIHWRDRARRTVAITLKGRLFEDIAPRIADLDGDGWPEIVTVETDPGRGARLLIFATRGRPGRAAAGPFIGRPFRWLAPAGIADLDGDGAVEIAYVDRPHLAKILRVWRYRGGARPRLEHVADLAGVTNHRIGMARIEGGVRRCGGRPELVLADAGWQRIVAVALTGGRLERRDLGRLGAAGLAAALACRE